MEKGFGEVEIEKKVPADFADSRRLLSSISDNQRYQQEKLLIEIC